MKQRPKRDWAERAADRLQKRKWANDWYYGVDEGDGSAPLNYLAVDTILQAALEAARGLGTSAELPRTKHINWATGQGRCSEMNGSGAWQCELEQGHSGPHYYRTPDWTR